MADALPQKDREFTNAHFLFADHKNATSFPTTIQFGDSATGAGIPGATSVLTIVNADTILLSSNATADSDDVTITFDGTIAVTGCQTRNGSATIRRGSYHVWIGFDGLKDERAAGGSGGSAIPVMLKTHPMDEGLPDDEKDFEWLKTFATSSGFSLVASVIAMPSRETKSVTLGQAASGPLWGAFTWGDGTIWGATEKSEQESGLPMGLIGTAHIFRLTGSVEKDFIFEGYVIGALVLPDRRLSRA